MSRVVEVPHRVVRGLINRVGESVLSFQNPRVVCPPGGVPTAEGQPIVVASIMRSGTHLAIDLLLNNFRQLAGRPLYVDVDRLFDMPDKRRQFLAGDIPIGACVVKTHYPQWPRGGRDEEMTQLVKYAKVLLLHRDPKDTYRSLQSWGVEERLGDWEVYQQSVEKFYRFWESIAEGCIRLHYGELIDRDSFCDTVHRIASETGLTPRHHVRYPVNPNVLSHLVLTKASTRLLGKYAPVINTGIRSGMTRK